MGTGGCGTLGPADPFATLTAADPAAARWSEPTRSRTLHRGHYPDRYVIALVLLVSSAIALPSGNTFALFQVVFGFAGGIAGWIVLPGRRRRRAAAVVPGVLGVAALLIGPAGLPFLVLPFLSWLWVRERPALSYLAAIPLVAVSVVVASAFDGWVAMPVAYGVTGLVFAGCAWLAREIARLRGERRATRSRTTGAVDRNGLTGGVHGPVR
jgi:hypothetical protein